MTIINKLLLLGTILITVNCYSKQPKQTIHIIKQGETVGALAKQYNVSIDDIFKANNINGKTILHLGQKLIIPSNKKVAANNAPSTKPAIKVADKPVPKGSHLIASGETLSKIAKQYNVSEQQLKDWNGLANSNIRAGDYLLVSKPATLKPPPAIVKEEPKKTETPKPIKPEPIAVQPKPTPKPAIIKPEPSKTVITKQDAEIKDIDKPTATIINDNKANDGYFEKQYASSNNSITGLCGTFKTIAGWQDKKYYVLLNNAQQGSIVKISANNNFVYAKVLGPLPKIKNEDGFSLRISNAAAAALGVKEDKFNVQVDY